MHKILSNSKKTFFQILSLPSQTTHISSEHKRSDLKNHTRPVLLFIQLLSKQHQNLLKNRAIFCLAMIAVTSFFLWLCPSWQVAWVLLVSSWQTEAFLLSHSFFCPTACSRHSDGWLGTSPKRAIASLAGKKPLLGSGYTRLASDDSVVGLGSSSAAKLIRKPLYRNFYRKANLSPLDLCRNFLKKA